MKKSLLFVIVVLVIHFSRAQSSLDSLRLVLPVGHVNAVIDATFSPDSKYVLTTSEDFSARLWDARSGRLLHILNGHRSTVYGGFSPDSEVILTLSDDQTAKLWHTKTGLTFRDLELPPGEITSVEFNSIGNLFMIVCDTRLVYFDWTTGNISFSLQVSGLVQAKHINSDNEKVVVLLDNGKVELRELSSGDLFLRLFGKFDCLYNESGSAFGDRIITTSLDNDIFIHNAYSGKLVHKLNGHENQISCIHVSPDGNRLVSASFDRKIRLWNAQNGDFIHEFNIAKVSLNDPIETISYVEFSANGSKLLAATEDKIIVWDASSLDFLYEINWPGSTSVCSAEFSPNGRYVLTSHDDYTARIWDAQTGSLIHILQGFTIEAKNVNMSKDGMRIINTNEKSWQSIDCNATVWELETGRTCLTIGSHNGPVNLGLFFSDDQRLLTISDDSTARIWDSSSGNLINVLKGHSKEIWTSACSSDGSRIVTSTAGGLDDSTIVWDALKGIRLGTFKGEGALFNADGNLLIINDSDKIKVLEIADIEKTPLFFDTHYSNSAFFSPDSKLILTTANDTAKIIDIVSGLVLYKLPEARKAIFSSQMTFVVTSSGPIVKVWDEGSGKLLYSIDNTIFDRKGLNYAPYDMSIDLSSDEKYILTGGEDYIIRIYDAYTGKLIKSLDSGSLFSPGLINVLFSRDNSKIIGNDRNKVILWDVATGKPIYERIQLEKYNYVVKLPNSPYYMCSKDASKMLHYVTPSMKVIGFDQLDPVYNRPDIVLDSIGKYFGGADQELVASYRLAWEKRVERLGLKKELIATGEIAVPNAEIANAEQLDYENKDGRLIIHVKAFDPKYQLQRYNVLVNEVPVYGSAGISIAGLHTQTWERTDTITLSKGRNKIQVSVMNELGLENFKYPTYVNYTPKEELASKTVFIGIGVNQFQESTHDLKYCVKDVQDLANEFARNQTLVDTLLLTNKEVTRESVLALRDYLMNNTTVSDKVIISCSSHGLLDDSLNFYLAMHDVDFRNPIARGLKYEELESLLDGIPARQKLLLLDACNSGENDKTELLKMDLKQKSSDIDTMQLMAARGVILEMEEENQNNFRKMNELFVNVRNNTGSVIISAAGGQQSALEAIEVNGQKIENGAFTYCVLEYMKSNEGNTDELTVNKLKQYVEDRVEQITGGKQKPTSRQETMELDWSIIEIEK